MITIMSCFSEHSVIVRRCFDGIIVLYQCVLVAEVPSRTIELKSMLSNACIIVIIIIIVVVLVVVIHQL
jgi:hypothetical protein